MKKKIAILGGGYAGVLTAKKLEKKIRKLKKSSEVEITLIDRNPFHTMLTELHEVAFMRVDEESIKISLAKVFAGRNVNVKTDEITSVDYNEKKLVGKNETYDYDYLIMASGSKPTFFNIPGAKENSYTLWSYEDAVNLRESVLNAFRKAACEANLEEKKKILTFYLVGAGFTGVEAAGELGELVPILCDKFEIDPKFVKIVTVDVLNKVCPIFPDKISNRLTKRLEKLNVKVLLETNVKEIGKDFITYENKGKTVTDPTYTVIWAAGIEGSDAVSSNEKIGLVGRGRVDCDDFLRSKADKNVYVGGDNIFYIPEGEKTPVPQMVENCEACAGVIANNLIFDLFGTGKQEKYAPKFHGAMVCVGGRYGQAYVGLPGKFFGLPSFFAMLSKHFINVLYFFSALGWNKVFSYIKHEFFTIRNKRSFLGGHFSNRSASFFLVPLRLYLGFYWVFEGIKKVNEGWLSKTNLDGFFNGANSFYEMYLNPGSAVSAATGEAAAAVTAATGEAVASVGLSVAEAAKAVLINWDFFGLFQVILINANDVAFKIRIPLVETIINKVALSSDGAQMFFQIVIVISEILIGLALMGGCFTTLSSFYSLILQVMFVTSTGLYMGTWWMFFAGIAMLFGAGSVFSIDYYLMPFLKKHWKNVKFVKRWYLYND